MSNYEFSIFSREAVFVALGVLCGCSGPSLNDYIGDYEIRKRLDNSGEVPIIRNIERIFPLVASDFKAAVDGLSFDFVPVKLGHSTIEKKTRELYEKLDQENAQIRTMVVGGYQAFLTSQLDTNEKIRTNGFKRWDDILRYIHKSANEVRTMKNQLLELKSRQAQAIERKAKAEDQAKLAAQKLIGAEGALEHLDRMASHRAGLTEEQLEDHRKRADKTKEANLFPPYTDEEFHELAIMTKRQVTEARNDKFAADKAVDEADQEIMSVELESLKIIDRMPLGKSF